MSREFAVRVRDSGSELAIVDGVTPVLTDGLQHLGLTANGFTVPADAVLFPGTYDFATTSPYVVVAETRLIGEGSEARATMLDPALTDLGRETYRRMVDESLEYELENGDRAGAHSAFTQLGAPTIDFAVEPLAVSWR